MFIMWSPCHLLPYDLGLMLWVLVEQQMSCLQSKASLSPTGGRLRPLIRHSLQRVGPGVLIQPQPYAKVVCGAI